MSANRELGEFYLSILDMARLEAYVARGREFESYSDEMLSDAWVTKIQALSRALAANPRGYDGETYDASRDLESEMTIRGRATPHDRVRNEMRIIVDTVRANTERLERNPAEMSAANEVMVAALVAALTPTGRLS